MAKDQDILDQVNELDAGEKMLRGALRETGGDPQAANLRRPDEVEGYLN